MTESMTTPATATPSATAVYALGRDPGESARLQRQPEELRPDSAAHSRPSTGSRAGMCISTRRVWTKSNSPAEG